MWATLCPDHVSLPPSWLQGELDHLIVLTEDPSLLMVWPTVTRRLIWLPALNGWEWGDTKMGRRIWESGNETWGSSLQSCGMNMKLKIIRVKVIKSNPLSGLFRYQKLTEQSERTKSASEDTLNVTADVFCPLHLSTNIAPVSSCVRLRQA